MSMKQRLVCALGVSLVLGMASCRQTQPVEAEPDFNRQLPAGASGLAPLDWSQLPDVYEVLPQFRNADFQSALQRSCKWYDAASSHKWYPRSGIELERAKLSVRALAYLIQQENNDEALLATVKREFQPYTSVGFDGSGRVLFTGYDSPIFAASLTETATYRYPIYKRPADMQYRDVGQETVVYSGRAELLDSGRLKGTELAWLADPFDAYQLEYNGSGRLRLTDGSDYYVGFAGTTGHKVETSIGRLLIKEGKIPESEMSTKRLRAYFAEKPEAFDHYVRQYPRMTFFQEYSKESWPAGCLGFPVTTKRTIASDKSIFPPAQVVWVRTGTDNRGRKMSVPINRLMCDQDAGGAIRAAGRADLYLGSGDDARDSAGSLAVEGRLYYFILRQDRVAAWKDKLKP